MPTHRTRPKLAGKFHAEVQSYPLAPTEYERESTLPPGTALPRHVPEDGHPEPTPDPLGALQKLDPEPSDEAGEMGFFSLLAQPPRTLDPRYPSEKHPRASQQRG